VYNAGTKVNFHLGSFDTIPTTATTTFFGDGFITLPTAFISELNGSTAGYTGGENINFYLFARLPPNGSGQNNSYVTYNPLAPDPDDWITGTTAINSTATIYGEGANVIWAYIGETSTVPEPSTAIAMGLLGVVGFAGNRRRRRSATV
jgi:hypothetical protein